MNKSTDVHNLAVRFNLIFMPISIINGMATSKRLSNFYTHLKDYNSFTIHNIVHEPKSKNLKTKLKESKIDNFDYLVITYNYKNPASIFKFFYFNYKILVNNYCKKSKNILYHSGYPNIRNIFIILFAKALGYKIVFDIVEDNSAITSFKSPLQWIKNKSSILLLNYISLFANGIICISDILYNKIENITGRKVPIIKIPVSYNENLFTNTAKKSVQKSASNIFYGGSFGEKDGIGYLLTAFDILAENYNVKLIMTGKGNEHDIRTFQTQLQKLKNKNKVKYLGYLEDNLYFEQVQSADILCMVRINNDFANAGFPFKLAEILATGKPVIATKVSDVKKYLTEGDAFLIEPERTDEIVEAIKFIIENPKIAKRVGENGQKVAKMFFNSARTAKLLMHFIQEEVK
jgi:glycosyltransferase involved in cell wall biosynthesis